VGLKVLFFSLLKGGYLESPVGKELMVVVFMITTPGKEKGS
jgi:hypothetical protein